MNKFPKPWYRTQWGVWYVTLNGRQHNLGPNRAAAFRKYHELMRAPAAKVSSDSVAAVLDAFLDWTEQNRPKSYAWYRKHLQAFLSANPSLPLRGRTPAFTA
ncbi:MAG: hypothetical protein FJ276_09690 [Planctomycetes bacterium]|nr:hypothetical protein [Planctomycetota bacterium]